MFRIILSLFIGAVIVGEVLYSYHYKSQIFSLLASTINISVLSLQLSTLLMTGLRPEWPRMPPISLSATPWSTPRSACTLDCTALTSHWRVSHCCCGCALKKTWILEAVMFDRVGCLNKMLQNNMQDVSFSCIGPVYILGVSVSHLLSLRESCCTVQWDHWLQRDVQLARHHRRRVWGSSGERFTQSDPLHCWEIHPQQPMWTHLSVQILWTICLCNSLVNYTWLTVSSCRKNTPADTCSKKKEIAEKQNGTFTGLHSAAGCLPISCSPCRSSCMLVTWWWQRLPSSSSPWPPSPPSWMCRSVFSP